MHEFICLPCACRTRRRPRPVESSTRFNPSKWTYFAPKIAITRSFIFLFIWTQKLFQSWAKILNCHSTKREILGLIFPWLHVRVIRSQNLSRTRPTCNKANSERWFFWFLLHFKLKTRQQQLRWYTTYRNTLVINLSTSFFRREI